ncbi:MAG: ATP-grasp domain-containing protein [Candidatus Saccharimonadales bacterium]
MKPNGQLATIRPMNAKQLVVGFFRERHDIEEFIFKGPSYQQAYHEIIDQLNEKGVYVAILMGQSSFKGKAHFSKHWVQVNDNGEYRFEKRGPITVDVVFEKDHFVSDGETLVLNSPQFKDMCWDKQKTYNLLGEFQPKTLVVQDETELEEALNQMSGDKVAVKAFEGSSGHGIFVGDKADVFGEEDLLKFPLLVQEFIETAGGVPGITDKRHDIRVVLTNGEPILATLRTPPEGGLKSNIGYGGEHRLVDIANLPTDLVELCHRIDKKVTLLSEYRLYSADFGLTPHGWRLFELNSMPGSINQARGKELALYYQSKLTDFLKKVAEAGHRKVRHG